MHQVFSHRRIGAHREGELALRSVETAGSLDDPVPKGIEFFKCPRSRAFRQRPGRRRGSQHLQFAGQIMGHHRTQGKNLIADQSFGGNGSQGGVIFRILKDGLLTAATMVEQDHPLG